MPAKVFISCGQNSPEERQVAQHLSAWFRAEGYEPYVAIDVMSILDLNAGIIGELKTSDYYLFVNFRREQVIAPDGSTFWRGSLYTNQELAIAYALGFDHMLLLNERDTRKEGAFHFIVTNIPEFQDFGEVLPLVQHAVQATGWNPTYTRQLEAENLRLEAQIPFIDHTGPRLIRPLFLDITNRRPDVGAVNCIGRLARLGLVGAPQHPSPDRSLIKATAFNGFEQTIWPKSSGTFDLLGVSVQNSPQLFLHSALDVVPRNPIINNPGDYYLEYEFFAQGFPPLTVGVRVHVTNDPNTTSAVIC